MVNLISSQKAILIENLYYQAFSIRRIASEASVAKNTVMRYMRMMPPILCLCGKPSTHRGWCSYRVSLSPGRQDFLMSFVRIKSPTIIIWNRTAARVRGAIRLGERLAAIDENAQSELRRFYNPLPLVGLEFEGDVVRPIAAIKAPQEYLDPILERFLLTLPVKEQIFVSAILDNATIDEASEDAELDSNEAAAIITSLRSKLTPLLLSRN